VPLKPYVHVQPLSEKKVLMWLLFDILINCLISLTPFVNIFTPQDGLRLPLGYEHNGTPIDGLLWDPDNLLDPPAQRTHPILQPDTHCRTHHDHHWCPCGLCRRHKTLPQLSVHLVHSIATMGGGGQQVVVLQQLIKGDCQCKIRRPWILLNINDVRQAGWQQ
jgi:hypothetical protein